jgi:carbon monoxide dehydrogenase subunit G
MAQGKAEVSINRSPDEVWKVIREFGTLDEWMPGIDKCTLNGDVRTVEMMGISVKEQLRSSDDAARTVSYSVIESPMGNLESHTATITVEPEGTGSHLTWTVDVSPDELLGLFVPIYEGSCTALKEKFES